MNPIDLNLNLILILALTLILILISCKFFAPLKLEIYGFKGASLVVAIKSAN